MIVNVEWRPDGYYTVTQDGISTGPFRTHQLALEYAIDREEHYDGLSDKR